MRAPARVSRHFFKIPVVLKNIPGIPERGTQQKTCPCRKITGTLQERYHNNDMLSF